MTTSPAHRLRRAVTASVVALLFGLVLVAVAGPAGALSDAPTVTDPAGSAAARADDRADVGGHLDAAVRASGAARGARPAALRAAGERTHHRVALVATATALAALLAALAELGRAETPGVDRLRRHGASPLGARAPPAVLAA